MGGRGSGGEGDIDPIGDLRGWPWPMKAGDLERLQTGLARLADIREDISGPGKVSLLHYHL